MTNTDDPRARLERNGNASVIGSTDHEVPLVDEPARGDGEPRVSGEVESFADAETTLIEPSSDLDEDGQSRPGRWAWLRGRRTAPGVEQFVTSTGTRMVAALIFVGIACGPLALLWQAASGARTVAPTAVQSTGPDPRAAIRAGAAATALVQTWLIASVDDADRLAAMVQVDPGQIDLPTKRPTPPDWVAVADAEPVGPDLWRITVTAAGGTAGPSATFAVLVTATDAGAAPVALPARIQSPAEYVSEGLTDAATGMAATGPVADTVTGFLNALVVTTDDQLARWVSPDSQLRPVGPVCDSVKLTQLLGPDGLPEQPADGSQISILATASCSTGHSTQTQQYPLILKARAGRWEVDRYATTAPGQPVNPTTPSDSTVAPSAAASTEPTNPASPDTNTSTTKPNPTDDNSDG